MLEEGLNFELIHLDLFMGKCAARTLMATAGLTDTKQNSAAIRITLEAYRFLSMILTRMV